MVTRLLALGGAVAVVGLGVGMVGPAIGSGGGGDGGRDRTITVLSTTTEEEFIDVGTPDFSLGDQFVFTSTLTKHGREVGRTGVACTITSVTNEESQCVGTASFRRGQITVQGLLSGDPESFTLAITGGTGAYKEAGGELTVRPLSADDDPVTKELLIFHLTD